MKFTFVKYIKINTKINIIPVFHLSHELGKYEKFSPEHSKIQNSNVFVNNEKIGDIYSLRPTFNNPNFWSMKELGKFMS